jgi:hypothetical protein
MNELNLTCQHCGEQCETWEEVNTAMIGTHNEIWCYCHSCKLDTFHVSPFAVNDPDEEKYF